MLFELKLLSCLSSFDLLFKKKGVIIELLGADFSQSPNGFLLEWALGPFLGLRSILRLSHDLLLLNTLLNIELHPCKEVEVGIELVLRKIVEVLVDFWLEFELAIYLLLH